MAMAEMARSGSSPVHDALASLASGSSRRREVEPVAEPSDIGGTPGAGWFLVVVAAAVIAIGSTLALMNRHAPHAANATSDVSQCSPITYGFTGMVPSSTIAEFSLAAGEVGRASGLVFVSSRTTHPDITIHWSSNPISDAETPAAAAGGAVKTPARVVAHGAGSWWVTGKQRRFVSGSIDVDASEHWHFGLDRGDSLATAFVHELGHVVGLSHDPEPGSFMFPRLTPTRPRWTDTDTKALTAIATEAGCTGAR